MAESVIGKLWDILRPLPGKEPPSAKVLAQRRKQKRLIRIALLILVLLGAGGGVYSYIVSAPQRAEKEYQAGMLQFRPGGYDKAIVHFNRAIEIWPQHARAYLDRGVAHRYLHQYDQALPDLDMALQLNPALSEAHSERGIIFRDQGDVKHAMDEFEKAVDSESTVEGFYELAQTYENMGEHQKAIDYYTKAIAELRDAPYVYRARALAKQKAGDLPGAEADRKEAFDLEHAPGH